MSRFPALLIAVSLGLMVALQPGLNADVARRLGNPVAAAFLSISISFALSAIYLLVTRQGLPVAALAGLPWYLWIGGVIGFVFVVGGLSVAPVLGGALLFAAIVLGQMIGAILADTFGIPAAMAEQQQRRAHQLTTLALTERPTASSGTIALSSQVDSGAGRPVSASGSRSFSSGDGRDL